MLIPEPVKPETSIRIGCVDWGSSHLGLAVLDWEWGKDHAVVVWSETVHVSDETHHTTYTETCGRRDRRLDILEAAWFKFLRLARPTFLITETPFMQRAKLSAFESGVEMQKMLRQALWEVYPNKYLYGVDPMTVKRYVGVEPKGTDKTHMAKAVQALYTLHSLIDLTGLDEHSIDAIAVGNYFVRSSLLNLNNLLPPKEPKPKAERSTKKRRRRRKKK